MYYVYLLKSKLNGDVYVGFSENLRERFQSHNDGKVKATKGYRPWRLVFYEAYRSKHDATRREKLLKTHKPKSDVMKQIKYSLAED